MPSRFAPLPTDLASAHALILAERTARLEAERTAANVQAIAAQADDRPRSRPPPRRH